MRRNDFKYLVILTTLTVCVGCATSPGRTIVPERNLMISFTFGGSATSLVEGLENIPLPINPSISVTYGLPNAINLGVSLYPAPVFAGQFLIEPYGSIRLIDQKDGVPEMNGHIAFPIGLSFQKFQFLVFTSGGISLLYAGRPGRIYSTSEITLEWTNAGTKNRFIHLNQRLGGSVNTGTNWGLEAEVSLLRIGEISVFSPVSELGIGIPAFGVGASCTIPGGI